MSHQELTKFENFFERHRQFEQTLIGDFQNRFEKLASGFIELQEKVLEEVRLKAPAYNIFSVLGLERSETQTHSAMLAHLFHPGGSHGQQHLFLKTFLYYCHSKYADFPLPTEKIGAGRWMVRTEKVIPNGRIDVELRNPTLKCLYLIENKVDASEQTDQLFRYYQWMQSKLNEFETQALIFLTPTGREAYSGGTGNIFQLSYHNDITTWLTQALTFIQADKVKMVLLQYLELVAYL